MELAVILVEFFTQHDRLPPGNPGRLFVRAQ